MRLIVFAAALSLAGPASAAGFDCTGPSTPDGWAIRASPKPSALDALVDRAYADVPGGGR